MASFKSINFAITDDVAEGDQSRLKALRSIAVGEPVGVGLERFDSDADPDTAESTRTLAEDLANQSDEVATRLQLQTYLEDAGNEWMAAITAPERGELVPDMQLSSITVSPGLGANSAVYQQSSHRIPIFGARIAVDIDSASKSLLAINGKVVPAPEKSPIADLSPKDALERLVTWSDCDTQVATDVRGSTAAPVLEWFLDEETEAWHLTYHFCSVFLAPREEPEEEPDDSYPTPLPMCLGVSPRSHQAIFDYFVDAHDGAVIYWFSSTPRADIPVKMGGVDTVSQPREFYGRQAAGGAFALSDPLRNIETYDYGFGDLDERPPPALPRDPITVPATRIGAAHPAAVSAHYHATLVFDFFNNVLKRKSIDDKGMKLVSVVNVYASRQNPLPATQWGNAVWWQGKMWYGNVAGQSYARHLDVIAHELAHGITESTSNLVYRDVPGALNESFSDFFGVVVSNWYPGEPNALSSWNWEIGPGLGAGGGPIRDFSNPARTGQPDHWSQYRRLPPQRDQGGVHIYSGIHNKALHHLLTDADPAGDPLFPTAEAVLMVYYTLTRLTPTSDFRDSRRTLESVIRVHHSGDPAAMADRLAAVAGAFGKVGL